MLFIDIQKHLHGSQGKMSLEVKLEVKEGEFIALMGESGSGKTTLLRILAGLVLAEGSVSVDNEVWLQNSISLAPQKRGIGFVFQDYALFENMSVIDNLLFVKNDKAFAAKLLSMTGLSKLSARNVKTLSGGQKQRVSLCRAMMNRPKLLLMDEPLSALDGQMKEKLQDEIIKLHKTFGTTTIMISHDTEASYDLADRVLVLEQGKIVKDGVPNEVFTSSTKVVYRVNMRGLA